MRAEMRHHAAMWLVLFAVVAVVTLAALALEGQPGVRRTMNTCAGVAFLAVGAALFGWGGLTALREPHRASDVGRGTMVALGLFFMALGAFSAYGGWILLRRTRRVGGG